MIAVGDMLEDTTIKARLAWQVHWGLHPIVADETRSARDWTEVRACVRRNAVNHLTASRRVFALLGEERRDNRQMFSVWPSAATMVSYCRAIARSFTPSRNSSSWSGS